VSLRSFFMKPLFVERFSAERRPEVRKELVEGMGNQYFYRIPSPISRDRDRSPKSAHRRRM
jgi:hypothetical protein